MFIGKKISRRLCNCLIFLLLFNSVTLNLFGQTTNIASALPPAAQEAIKKGILATKIPDYLLAIRYFEEARKAAPQSPEVFYNLGLAESKISGRELRASCWFAAYLTVNPDAANASAIKEQINMLLIKNFSNLTRLIKSLQDTYFNLPVLLYDNTEKVSVLWAFSGDFTNAIKIANTIDHPQSTFTKNYLLKEIALYQISKGDIEDAKKTMESITDSRFKCEILTTIASTQIAAEDFIVAKTTLDASIKLAESITELRKEEDRYNALIRIEFLQRLALDSAAAQNTFVSLKKFINQIQDEELRNRLIKKFEEYQKLYSYHWQSAQISRRVEKIEANLKKTHPMEYLKKLIGMLDANIYSQFFYGQLKTDPFLDIAGHLKSIASTDPQKYFDALWVTVDIIANNHNEIETMLKQIQYFK